MHFVLNVQQGTLVVVEFELLVIIEAVKQVHRRERHVAGQRSKQHSTEHYELLCVFQCSCVVDKEKGKRRYEE